MERKALHTEIIKSGKRTFTFKIKQTEKGASYLTIKMAKKVDDDNTERQQIIIFENEMEKFSEAFMRTLINFRTTGRDAYIEETRQKYPNAFTPWTKEAEEELEVMYAEEKPITEIAKHFQRNETAIIARIEKLKLDEKYIVSKAG